MKHIHETTNAIRTRFSPSEVARALDDTLPPEHRLAGSPSIRIEVEVDPTLTIVLVQTHRNAIVKD